MSVLAMHQGRQARRCHCLRGKEHGAIGAPWKHTANASSADAVASHRLHKVLKGQAPEMFPGEDPIKKVSTRRLNDMDACAVPATPSVSARPSEELVTTTLRVLWDYPGGLARQR